MISVPVLKILTYLTVKEKLVVPLIIEEKLQRKLQLVCYMLHTHIHYTTILMKKYISYVEEQHNTAFSLLIIPGIESTGSTQFADTTHVSPPLEESTVGGSSTSKDDKGETTTGTEQYKNNYTEKYKTTVKALA